LNQLIALQCLNKLKFYNRIAVIMRKFTSLRVFPATYRICITPVISVLPLATESTQVKFTQNDRSPGILIFPYICLARQTGETVPTTYINQIIINQSIANEK
jgi:hypothetical protein